MKIQHTEGFGCYAKAILVQHKHPTNASATTTVGHRHTGTLHSGGKIKICKTHQAFEMI